MTHPLELNIIYLYIAVRSCTPAPSTRRLAAAIVVVVVVVRDTNLDNPLDTLTVVRQGFLIRVAFRGGTTPRSRVFKVFKPDMTVAGPCARAHPAALDDMMMMMMTRPIRAAGRPLRVAIIILMIPVSVSVLVGGGRAAPAGHESGDDSSQERPERGPRGGDDGQVDFDACDAEAERVVGVFFLDEAELRPEEVEADRADGGNSADGVSQPARSVLLMAANGIPE